MTATPEAARTEYAQHRWGAARDLFAAAASADLTAVDLERWGLAAFLTGHDDESDTARERAHHAYARAGDVDGACRVAYWLALALTLRGEPARGGGWFRRVGSVLDGHSVTDSVWTGFLLVPRAMAAFFGNDLPTSLALSEQAIAYAGRFGDPDLAVLAHNAHGQALVGSGAVEAGLSELDEVMVRVTTAEDVSPQLVGLVYCAVINTCRDVFDVRRSREWTNALSRWCAAQPDLVPYRGQCTVHRAEILQLTGSWPDADTEVARACAQAEALSHDPATGMALYQRGELLRLRGDLVAAEAAYRAAIRVGHDPQPGFALLRLAERRTGTALAAIRRALDEASRPSLRARLLPAYVEIALAAGDVEAALRSAEELVNVSGPRSAPLLDAAAQQAIGAVRLAEGDPAAALPCLRRARSLAQAIPAPYDAARCRTLIALACRALGDHESAELEFGAARWIFEQLGAVPEVERMDSLTRRSEPPAPGGLTLREVEVLRAVATGATNRAIAEAMFLSEKTVARHVANIFTKLDLSSRAAATAFAYEHRLV